MPKSLNLDDGKIINSQSPCFIIAEIGQNHQGDIRIAKELIKTAKDCGADCVKFQKSCLQEKFTKQALAAPYINKNSWGKTYGEHKNYLEFSEDEFIELQKTAEENEILFTASAMDPKSLEFLNSLNVPFIKIGSGDANNHILIEKAAALNTPLVISTGMQTMENVEKVYNLVKKHHLQFSLLHCVSAYPTPPSQANLRVLLTYKQKFPDIIIGYSGHEENYNLTLASVALGAKIVERHITLDNTWKGNDHKCSLNPHNFRKMVACIREVEIALGDGEKMMQLCEKECFEKLGKCLVAAKFLPKGYRIRMEDVKVKVSPVKGVTPNDIDRVLGRTLKDELEVDDAILEGNLE